MQLGRCPYERARRSDKRHGRSLECCCRDDSHPCPFRCCRGWTERFEQEWLLTETLLSCHRKNGTSSPSTLVVTNSGVKLLSSAGTELILTIQSLSRAPEVLSEAALQATTSPRSNSCLLEPSWEDGQVRHERRIRYGHCRRPASLNVCSGPLSGMLQLTHHDIRHPRYYSRK